MKPKECPECGGSIRECWCSPGRRLRYECSECSWRGKPRIPTKLKIPTSRTVDVDQFEGWNYEAFDKYGHHIELSRSYSTRSEAVRDLNQTLDQGVKDEEAGPYTIVLYPATVSVKGEVFKR